MSPPFRYVVALALTAEAGGPRLRGSRQRVHRRMRRQSLFFRLLPFSLQTKLGPKKAPLASFDLDLQTDNLYLLPSSVMDGARLGTLFVLGSGT